MTAAARMPVPRNTSSRRTQDSWKPHLKVWTCAGATASVVVAATEEAARPLLREALRQLGIENSGALTLEALDLTRPSAVVLVDRK